MVTVPPILSQKVCNFRQILEYLQNQFLHTFRKSIEGVKWCGTLVLLCIYTLQGAPKKGWKLVLFRKNVTKGLLGLIEE